MSARIINVNWSDYIKYTEKDTADIPVKAGVYEYYVKIKDSNNMRYQYVGRATNLQDRFNKHLSDDEENECLKELIEKYIWYYRYALISKQADREDAELGLYNKHNYECNKITPTGSGQGKFEIVENE